MKHSLIQEQLSEYVDNRLSAKELARVESHLRDCEECQEISLDFRLNRNEIANLRQAYPSGIEAAINDRVNWWQRCVAYVGRKLKPLESKIGFGICVASIVFLLWGAPRIFFYNNVKAIGGFIPTFFLPTEPVVQPKERPKTVPIPPPTQLGPVTKAPTPPMEAKPTLSQPTTIANLTPTTGGRLALSQPTEPPKEPIVNKPTLSPPTRLTINPIVENVKQGEKSQMTLAQLKSPAVGKAVKIDTSKPLVFMVNISSNDWRGSEYLNTLKHTPMWDAKTPTLGHNQIKIEQIKAIPFKQEYETALNKGTILDELKTEFALPANATVDIHKKNSEWSIKNKEYLIRKEGGKLILYKKTEYRK